jgi:hypothetical protein
MDRPDAVSPKIVFVGGGVAAADVKPSGDVFDFFHRLFCVVVVLVGEPDLPARIVAFVRYGSLPCIDPQTVCGIIGKLVFHSVFQTCTGSKEDDQHKDSPCHTKTSEECTQLVFADRTEDLLPLIDQTSGNPI